MPDRVPTWKALACGAGMGLADAVPGVSGGTVLLVAGLLDAYLAALATGLAVLRRPWEGARWRALGPAVALLAPLVAAQAAALIVGVLLLVGAKPDLGHDAASARAALAAAEGLLVNSATAPTVFAVFFALVAVSIGEPWRARRTRRAGVDAALLAAGAAVAGTLALLPAAAGEPGVVLIALGGAVAIAVMILPGISGSLVLLLLGLYQSISAAVHARDAVVLGAFAAGVLLGLALAVPLLRALLARAHDRVMAVLAGLMLGSLVALWPWKAHHFPGAIPLLGPMWPQLPGGAWWWPVLAATLAGAGGWWLLRRMASAGAGSAGQDADGRHTARSHG